MNGSQAAAIARAIREAIADGALNLPPRILERADMPDDLDTHSLRELRLRCLKLALDVQAIELDGATDAANIVMAATVFEAYVLSAGGPLSSQPGAASRE